MGNSNAPTPRYRPVRTQQHELLGTLTLVEDSQTQRHYLSRQITLASEEEFQRLSKELKQRQTLSQRKAGEHIIRLQHFEVQEVSELCGKSHRVTLYLEHLPRSLREEKGRMGESAVVGLVRAVAEGLLALRDNCFRNLHLWREAIFFSEQGEVKLVDSQLSSRIHPFFQLQHNVPIKPHTYLSPELLAQLRSDAPQFDSSPKTDIFTLAVLTLELLTGEYFDACFDYEKKTVDMQALQQIAQSTNCSQSLKSILQRMLVEDEQERIGLVSLVEMLSDSVLHPQDSWTKVGSEQPKYSTTARTFISRSKDHSSREKNSMNPRMVKPSQFKVGEMKEQKRPISEYVSRQESKPSNQVRTEQASCKQSQHESQVVFAPIEAVETKFAHRLEALSLERRIPHIPKNYDTPVNLLISQPEREATSTRKIEPFNSTGERRTYGRHFFTNGARYQGEFNSKNQLDGSGMLFYPEGHLCYSGSWQQNCFHGFGVLHNQNPTICDQPTNWQQFSFAQRNDWLRYEGEFNRDCKQGFGTLQLTNGDKFSGCFKADAIEGFGTFFIAKQQRNINGIWQQNKLKQH